MLNVYLRHIFQYKQGNTKTYTVKDHLIWYVIQSILKVKYYYTHLL